jgi:pyruvate/2-oxoacid:ferredoxin oxidoreductase alpha subunit
MKINDKPRSFEYSSLVMGSKDIPLAAFPAKRPLALTSAKIFTRKSDLLSAKYSKIKNHKIRTRN